MQNTITDEFMRQMLAATKDYCMMILRAGPNWNQTGRDKVIWEHGRRNFQLRADGIMSIVCPVVDGGDIKGIGIFNRNAQETSSITDQDPGVQAGIFRYEVHVCRGFPGDFLAR